MLIPDYLDHLADDILEFYSRLDETIIRDITRRIIKTGVATSTVAWQTKMVQQSGLLYDDVISEISRISNASKAQVKAIFEDAGVETVQWDNSIYEAAGLAPPIRMLPSAFQTLKAGIAKTNQQLNNLTLTTAVQAQQTFIQAMTLAEMQIESGAFDYFTAIRNAVIQASDDGSWVQYPSGHRDRLDVAIRRAVLTGVGQTTGEISLLNAQAMGCDLMEITAHAGARPSHAIWQGKLVSLSGRDGYLSTSDIGWKTGPGFKGWNCHHDWFPYFEGLSENAYPRKVLEEYEKRTVDYNGEKIPYYDATQKQRSMERGIRDIKRELSGLDEAIKNTESIKLKVELKEQFALSSVQLKKHKARLNDFLEQTDLSADNKRVQLQGFGRSQAQKAVWASKTK